MKTLPYDALPKEGTSQRTVYDYLVSGRKLTRQIADTNLGVGSVSSRIAELRRKGLEIEEDWAEDHFNRRYKRYFIKQEEKAQ